MNLRLGRFQYLADLGAPLFLASKDSVGMQPLHWATTEGHLNVVHFLMTRVREVGMLNLRQAMCSESRTEIISVVLV